MNGTHLTALGVPAATAKLASWFARNPTARPTVRELQRTIRIASASAQRDLDRLTRAHALRVIVDGRMRRYAAVIDSPIWTAVRILLGVETPAPQQSSTRVRENAKRWGVDITQLESMLRLSIEERIVQLDANAAFFAQARKGLAR